MSHGEERVSIVLPFYRSEKFIAEAIESVLGQEEFTGWRLYLVDDGSDQSDGEIAQRYSKAYPDRIRLLAHKGREHLGTSAARNLGMRRAAGELVAFLDADDVWYPHKLRSQVALLEAHPDADMLYGAALRWYSWNGGVDLEVPVTVRGYGSNCLVPGPALLATFLEDESLTPCTGSVLIRRAALERAGYFEDQFRGLYDDQVLYSKLCRSGSVYVSSDCVSRYRQHAESCCSRGAAEGKGPLARAQFLEWLSTQPGSDLHPTA